MDEIVKAALAKWPNVPHCTGWLLLDRRGQWRMRDEGVQARGELGAPVRHAALTGFINRNYACDERGQWFFQNGPQRVYVELAYTPWVVRLSLGETGDSRAASLVDQTGAAFEPASALIDEEGAVLFVEGGTPGRVALLHDHDLGLFTECASLDENGTRGHLNLGSGSALPIDPIARAEVPLKFGFVQSPAAAPATAERPSDSHR